MKSVHIVKVGGKITANRDRRNEFLDSFTSLPGPKILVHGGGPEATALAKKLGINTEMIHGRRITSDDMLEVATMVYAGLINKRLVAELNQRSLTAIGLSGADGDLIRANKRIHSEIDFGWVGDITSINQSLLIQLLTNQLVPVVCSLTHNGRGQLLNTNADTIACEVARSLAPKFEITLSFCFEYPGVMEDVTDNHSIIGTIDRNGFRKLLDSQKIHSGMLPKLETGFLAAAAGAHVRICGIKNMATDQMATKLIHQ